MASNDLALLRLYLDDPDESGRFFDDDVLETLLQEAGNDTHGAAALGWSMKAAHVWDWYLSQTDGALLSRDQVFKHCMDMADFHEGKSSAQIVSVQMDSGGGGSAVESTSAL